MYYTKTYPRIQIALIGCTLIDISEGNNVCLLGVFFGEQEIEAMDADDILARQVEQLDKEKRELQIRQKTQEKKVRHTCTVVVPLPRHRRDSHLYIYPLQKKFPQKTDGSRKSRVGAVVRALAFHQCVPGSIPGFPSPQKPTFNLI